jgi:hypothetical protein
MLSIEIQTIAAVVQALAAAVFLGGVVYDVHQRKKLREQERRDNVIKALCYQFDTAHGFPTQVNYGRAVTAEEGEDLHKQRIDFVNTRLKEMGETWTYPDRKQRPIVSHSDILRSTPVNIRQFSRWCWARRPDATQTLAFGTWALALVAFIAMLDGRWALEQSQRAWIAPTAASQNPQHPLSRDTPFPFVINYTNTGREPAIDVNVSGGQAFTKPPPPHWREGEWSDFRTGDNNTCDGQRPIPNGPVIYQQTYLALITSTAL